MSLQPRELVGRVSVGETGDGAQRPATAKEAAKRVAPQPGSHETEEHHGVEGTHRVWDN